MTVDGSRIAVAMRATLAGTWVLAVVAGGVSTAAAAPMPAGAQVLGLAADAPVHQARSVLRKLFDSMDDDDYVHDDHYDWQAYRDSTSRKDRVRDFYRMQTEMQKDAIRSQLQAQKKMIKAQRGW